MQARKLPSPGDTILYWYTKSSTDKPGLYGWGTIFQYNESNGIMAPAFYKNKRRASFFLLRKS
jgi:hypothetical protein